MISGVCAAALCENVEGSFLCFCADEMQEFDPTTGECHFPRPPGTENTLTLSSLWCILWEVEGDIGKWEHLERFSLDLCSTCSHLAQTVIYGFTTLDNGWNSVMDRYRGLDLKAEWTDFTYVSVGTEAPFEITVGYYSTHILLKCA